MNTQDFLLIATKIKEFSTYAIPFAITLFSFLYVRARAGSAGFFHDRLWRLLGGKRDYQCPVLQAESDKLSDHEKFTYNTGIRFQNRHKIEETLQWMETQKIGIEEVVRAKAFFDPRDLSFRKPKLNRYRYLHNLSIWLVVAFTITFALFSVPYALLSIKQTGTIIWASTSTVKSWNGYSWEATAADCKDEEIPTLILDAHDQKVICEILSKPELSAYLESAMQTQKLTGLLIWLLSGVFAFFVTRLYVIAKLADDLHERTQSQLPSQLTLLFPE
ncbi:DUF6216 family protein [Pseudomonas aeruginosa]|uniref:DUF6216 family protein n=1 Tax=Pseudomonas aeruginosa TaxID=287 RepID=UPI000B1620FA|nr:DUF6216 family protein [Pseudomonas aeruginosa]EKV2963971.1 hypothetical protein [Pseudomonas aeruginosa]EKV3144200.1 hypothetical protein [Pseudomonas aeruginosa]HEK0922675.1 hypothetical protein [Pseudomonas aeruginosa]